MNRLAFSLSVVVLTALASAPALADTAYTYQGNTFATKASPPYVTSSEFLSGSFTVSSPLAPDMSLDPVYPTQFSFSDSVDTVTNVSAAFSNFQFSTDDNGNITAWSIHAGWGTGSYLDTENFTGQDSIFDGAYILVGNVTQVGVVINDPGTWTVATIVPAATPEPSSLLLLGTTLFGAASILRRRLTL